MTKNFNNITLVISTPAEDIYEKSLIIDTKYGKLECMEQATITKNGSELNCHVSFYLKDGTEFYTYESLNFGKYLDEVKKFTLSLLVDEIINKAEKMMAA